MVGGGAWAFKLGLLESQENSLPLRDFSPGRPGGHPQFQFPGPPPHCWWVIGDLILCPVLAQGQGLRQGWTGQV